MSIKNSLPFNSDMKWDYENGFYLTSDVNRIAKLCAHFELYKSIINLPGAVIECGVYKGASLIRWATFREMLEVSWSRPVVGFDAFGSFPRTMGITKEDIGFINEFEQEGGDGFSEEQLQSFIELKGLSNVELIAGNILETVPKYLQSNPHTKIALLHIDVDVYEPTKLVLDLMYDRLVPGGLLVLDDYSTVEGETRAVDEYFSGRSIDIQKLPFCTIPAFIRKN